jgi:general secretion pathway protein I
MNRAPLNHAAHGGFTLVEVLVALVIVAFGVGAVLSALSSSAGNIAAMREKTLAQWVALNRIADVRLALQPPMTGTVEGDLRSFGNGDWHWQQVVTAVDQIPGLLQITVKVRRNAPGTLSGSGSSTSSTSAKSSSGGGGSSSGGDWITTVIGFRGDALAAASGEVPDWTGVDYTNSSSGSGGTSTGTAPTPGASSAGGSGSTTSPSPLTSPPTSSPTTPGAGTPPVGSSAGGP